MKKNNQKMVAHINAAQQQDPEQALNILMAEKLSTTLFETTPEEREHLAWLQRQRKFLSIIELSGQIENYKKLVSLSTEDPMTLLEASFFLNGCNRLRPNDLGMNDEEYISLIERNDQVVIKWNNIVTPMKTAGMKEVMTKLTRNIIMPEPKKIIHN